MASLVEEDRQWQDHVSFARQPHLMRILPPTPPEQRVFSMVMVPLDKVVVVGSRCPPQTGSLGSSCAIPPFFLLFPLFTCARMNLGDSICKETGAYTQECDETESTKKWMLILNDGTPVGMNCKRKMVMENLVSAFL